MLSLRNQVIARVKEAFVGQFTDLSKDFEPNVTLSTQSQFGHYQCNNAMAMAKTLKQNPRDIASKVASFLNKIPFFETVEVAGPGFINLWLNQSELEKQLMRMLSSTDLGIAKQKTERVVVDFSSPNVAKEMHVGHLRSTIIGDSIARLFEFLGYHVLRLNHIGDWGTSFGMLIAYLKEHHPTILEGAQPTDVQQLEIWYKAAKAEFDASLDFQTRAKAAVVSLQQGDPEARKAWQLICEISEKSYQTIYDFLNVHLIHRGESFYNSALPGIVSDLQDKGLLQVSDGAQCAFLPGFKNREGNPLPLMVQKSDGGYNYSTTDLAALKHRVTEEKTDRIIYVTDSGQALHFKMLFELSKLAGYYDPEKTKLDHVPFGLVLGPDGKKFKTRSGETEKLIDLLTRAVAQAKDLISARYPDISPDTLQRLSERIGIGAVKYADLACNRTGDYRFSYEKMLKFEGNTAPYLMYAYVRVRSIQRKKNVEKDAFGLIELAHPCEQQLGLHLRQFHEILESITQELLPNRLCEYLFNLAEMFHAFFQECRVLGSPEEDSRLSLCELTASVMRQGLYILGLEVVESM